MNLRNLGQSVITEMGTKFADTMDSNSVKSALSTITEINLPSKQMNILAVQEKTSTETETGALSLAEEEQGSKMLQVMDWAFDKANGNIPGFGTSKEMAQKYLDKYGSVNAAIDHLVNWQITSAATAGFVTNLGGLAAMPVTLPANIAGVMAIQLRMIGAIAELGGCSENSEERRTGMYLCLLGSQAGDALSKTTSQVAVKFATASLKRLPGSTLININKQVGFRLITKFGQKGVINLQKAIPVLGGVIGGAVDGFSTYAIAKAAKAMFLEEIINFEKQEQLEVDKIHLLINLANVDNDYADDEKALIYAVASGLNISDKTKALLQNDIEHPKKFVVDMTPFKDDAMLASSTLCALSQVAQIGDISPVEKMYITELGQTMGFDLPTIQAMIEPPKKKLLDKIFNR